MVINPYATLHHYLATAPLTGAPSSPARARYSRIAQLLRVLPGETRQVAWSFLYFFALLCGYYILRPVRDEMAIRAGVDQLQWLFTATFIGTLVCVPLFGLLVSRLPRRVFLPLVYAAVCASLMAFFAGFSRTPDSVLLARCFYVWVSVFNLFVVSVFWSFMVDIFSPNQSTRLFGLIAAGGTAGAIAGPALTVSLVGTIGVSWLLPVSAALFAFALICIHQLLADTPPRSDDRDRSRRSVAALGGGMLAGLRMLRDSRYLQGICLLILLYSCASTFLYFTQAHIVAADIADSEQRTRLFALIDLAVNVLTVGAQLFATNRIAERFGLSTTLALIPALLTAGFMLLGIAPVLAVLVVVQVLRRAGNYAVMKPAREMLFTVLSPAQKYKGKNLVDTLVYRGGDAVSGWLYAGMRGIGLDTGAIAFAAVPLCGLWMFTGLRLGTKFARLRRNAHSGAAANPDHYKNKRKQT